MLATRGIRSSKRTSKNVFQCIQPLADEPEEEENQQTFTSHLHNKKETSTVHGILISIKRLTSNCFQALNPHFLNWTRPATSSLILGTLTDLARRKSELVAENALLRQQLIILRRQVKRPACTRVDRMLLVLLARMVLTWKQALFIVQEDDASAMASPGIQAVLEVQVQSSFCQTKDLSRDCGVDQGDGKQQSASSEPNVFVANYSSWAFASANARSKST